MESNTMTNTELIEKCKKIIDGMGRYAYEQIQLSDLLTRFQKAQKENETTLDLQQRAEQVAFSLCNNIGETLQHVETYKRCIEAFKKGCEYTQQTSHVNKCDECGCHPSVLYITAKGSFCQDHYLFNNKP